MPDPPDLSPFERDLVRHMAQRGALIAPITLGMIRRLVRAGWIYELDTPRKTGPGAYWAATSKALEQFPVDRRRAR